MIWLNWVGMVYIGVWVTLLALGIPGLIKMTHLRLDKMDEISNNEQWPTVTIIVTACNEEESIADSLRSLGKIDYPHLQIIAINDRSVDDTGRRIREVANEDQRIEMLEVEELPTGWLGKNHALFLGSQATTGEWLLFTDADVIFHPFAVKIAMHHVLTHKFDHLSIAPHVKIRSMILRGLILVFMFNLMLFFRPQNAKNSQSKAHMGVGAFNLISKEAYQKIGTHEAIRMRPDDDLKLGELVKKYGLRQDFALGDELITVEWYRSVSEMIRGLEKNTMAPFEYQFWKLFLGLVPLSFLYLLPFYGLFFVEGWGIVIYIILFFIGLFAFSLHDRFSIRSFVYYLLFPIIIPLFLYALLRAAILTWVRGGIMWRGTLYSLQDLKKGAVPKA